MSAVPARRPPPWDPQRDDGTEGPAFLVGRVLRLIDPPPPARGERVVQGPKDMEPPLQVVNRRWVCGREVWDVVDALGRFCAAGSARFVSEFVDYWGR